MIVNSKDEEIMRHRQQVLLKHNCIILSCLGGYTLPTILFEVCGSNPGAIVKALIEELTPEHYSHVSEFSYRFFW